MARVASATEQGCTCRCFSWAEPRTTHGAAVSAGVPRQAQFRPTGLVCTSGTPGGPPAPSCTCSLNSHSCGTDGQSEGPRAAVCHPPHIPQPHQRQPESPTCPTLQPGKAAAGQSLWCHSWQALCPWLWCLAPHPQRPCGFHQELRMS